MLQFIADVITLLVGIAGGTLILGVACTVVLDAAGWIRS